VTVGQAHELGAPGIRLGEAVVDQGGPRPRWCPVIRAVRAVMLTTCDVVMTGGVVSMVTKV